MRKTEIAIVGGGASGMAAGISAAQNGKKVIVFEGLPRVGKKLLATGNGRCNITNLSADHKGYHGERPEFTRGVMEQYGVEDTLGFFRFLGLETKVEEEGKVYPWSDQANSVLDLLRYEAETLCQEVLTGVKVTEVKKTPEGFFLTTEGGERYTADRVIIATGGKAAPQLGASESGYHLASMFGHRVTELYPGIVQIKCDHPRLKALKGIKVQGALSLYEEEMCIRSEAGEILFTEYGISGPPALQISGGVHRVFQGKKRKQIRIDIFPALSASELYESLWMVLGVGQEKEMELVLSGIMNKTLGRTLLQEAGIHPREPGRNLTEENVKHLCKLMKKWRMDVTGTLSWQNAQVTIGGVSTAEVETRTLESKRVEGLYFCGEVLDVDGDCGGYNLQWAWSSGIVAGEKAAKKR